MKKSDKEIVDAAEFLVSQDSARNTVMDELVTVFKEAKFTNRLNKVLSDNRNTPDKRVLLVNFVKARVLDKINLLSMLPDLQVDAPFGVEHSETYAELWMRVNLGWWDEVSLKTRFSEMGYFMPLFGTNVSQLHPSIKDKKIRFLTRDPRTFHAFINMADPMYYDEVYFIYKSSGQQINAAYPGINNDRIKDELVANTYSEYYTCIERWDNDHFDFLVNNKRVAGVGIEHNLGFIPVRATPNIRIPGQLDGLSDVVQEIGMAENQNELLIMSTEEIRERLYARLFLYGDGWPKQIPTGRGAVVRGAEGDKADYMSPIKDVAPTHQHLMANDQFMRVAMGWPSQRSGVFNSAIWTGKGIDASMGPVSDDVMRSKESIGEDLRILNQYYFKMLRKFWGKEKLVVHGTYLNKRYGVDFTPGEELPEVYSHQVHFSPLGHDIPTMIVNLLQLHGQGVFSLMTVLEKIPGVNPAEEMRRLDEELMKKVSMEQKIAAMAQQLQTAMVPQGMQASPEEMENAAHAMSKGGMVQ